MSDFQTVKVDVDKEIWRMFGIIAAAKGEYKRDLLNDVLREYVEKEKGRVNV